LKKDKAIKDMIKEQQKEKEEQKQREREMALERKRRREENERRAEVVQKVHFPHLDICSETEENEEEAVAHVAKAVTL
jgi:hypothetical protein